MFKRLIVCCDGTWNTADQALDGRPSPTNITKLALAIAPWDSVGTRQRVYYHGGVGTGRTERIRGGVFGLGLSRNVFDAYRFLVDNYEHGDALFFFGFSRGAFTARSTVGLVHNCGILRPENHDRIDEAWALYRDSAEKPSGMASTLFRRSYSHDPRIRFVGVFDTVGTLGIPILGPGWLEPIIKRLNRRSRFHNTALSPRVDGAFHALAIDEQRASFEPTLWHQQLGTRNQTLKQVWFAGEHCDVGGGCRITSLSDIALLWMVDQARKYGLQFRQEVLSQDCPSQVRPGESICFKVAPNPMARPHRSRTGIYRYLGSLNRPIGTAADKPGRLDGCEYVAASAKNLYDAGIGYRPEELERYLENQSDVHIEPVPYPEKSASRS